MGTNDLEILKRETKMVSQMDPRQLRYFKRYHGAYGATISMAVGLAAGIYAVFKFYQVKMKPLDDFYRNYNEELEWKRLLESGLLKTVDSEGNLIDLSE